LFSYRNAVLMVVAAAMLVAFSLGFAARHLGVTTDNSPSTATFLRSRT
jgi:hypothetical protein